MISLLRWSTLFLLAALIGCSPMSKSEGGEGQSGSQQSKGQEGQSGGGKSKAQSAGDSSALDQELKRQSDIYKEHLKHNADQTAQHRKADKKLLDQMRKNEQKVLQDEVKRLQIRQGLRDEEQGGSSGDQE